jgi:hypothetical protein
MTTTTSTPLASETTQPTTTNDAIEATSRDAGGQGSPEPPSAEPVRFGESVVLSKGEVFGACQALADADRLLLRGGGKSEASALGDLFELLEARLSRPDGFEQPHVSRPATG